MIGAEHGSSSDEYATDLHFAVKANDLTSIQNLIDNGAQVQAPDKFGRTPLHWALVFGHKRAAHVLMVHTSRNQLECKDNLGCTPLHYAASGARTDLGRSLLERGAQINSTDSTNRTPLHYAAQNVEPTTVEMLTSRGADKECLDSRGFLPRDVAIEWGSLSSLACLRPNYGKLMSPIQITQLHQVNKGPRTSKPHGQDARSNYDEDEDEKGKGEEVMGINDKEGSPSFDKLMQAWKIIENNTRRKREEERKVSTKVSFELKERLREWRIAEMEAKRRKLEGIVSQPLNMDNSLEESKPSLPTSPSSSPSCKVFCSSISPPSLSLVNEPSPSPSPSCTMVFSNSSPPSTSLAQDPSSSTCKIICTNDTSSIDASPPSSFLDHEPSTLSTPMDNKSPSLFSLLLAQQSPPLAFCKASRSVDSSSPQVFFNEHSSPPTFTMTCIDSYPLPSNSSPLVSTPLTPSLVVLPSPNSSPLTPPFPNLSLVVPPSLDLAPLVPESLNASPPLCKEAPCPLCGAYSNLPSTSKIASNIKESLGWFTPASTNQNSNVVVSTHQPLQERDDRASINGKEAFTMWCTEWDIDDLESRGTLGAHQLSSTDSSHK